MNRLFFVCGLCILLGAGCGSSSSVTPVVPEAPVVVPSTTTQAVPKETTVAPTPSTTIMPASSDALQDPAVETLSVSMTSGNFFFDPAIITASPGQNVSISITGNEGTHTFVIEEIGLKKQVTTGTVITFAAPIAPGSYAYYCDVGAHRKLGMEGMLIVK